MDDNKINTSLSLDSENLKSAIDSNSNHTTPSNTEKIGSSENSNSHTSSTPNSIHKTSKFSIKTIVSTIIFLLLAGGAAAGFVYREPIMKLVSKPSPTPTHSPATSSAMLTPYIDSTYNYSFNYPENILKLTANEKNDYGYVALNSGCFEILSIPESLSLITNNDLKDVYENLSKLDTIAVNQSIVLTQTGSTQTIRTTYSRLPNKSISDLEWKAFDKFNDFENHGVKRLYFISKDKVTYFITTFTGGPCTIDPNGDDNRTWDQILSSFNFTDTTPLGAQYSSEGESCGPNAGAGGNAQCAPSLNCEYQTTQQKTDKIGTCVSSKKSSSNCIIGGCSGQLCISKDAEPRMTTCEYRAEYACYKDAKCEEQIDGTCGWTLTPQLKQCISDNRIETN